MSDLLLHDPPDGYTLGKQLYASSSSEVYAAVSVSDDVPVAALAQEKWVGEP